MKICDKCGTKKNVITFEISLAEYRLGVYVYKYLATDLCPKCEVNLKATTREMIEKFSGKPCKPKKY